MLVRALELEPSFSVEVVARLADGSSCPLARVGGVREPLATPRRPELNPLMVNTIGRSGSNWLAWLLSCHRTIVAFSPSSRSRGSPPTGPPCCSRWRARRATCASSDTGRSTRNAGGWTAPTSSRLRSTRMAELARQRRRRVARRPLPVAHRGLLPPSSPAQREARRRATSSRSSCPTRPARTCSPRCTPARREVILVRDFRDMLCSVIAFNEKRGYRSLRQSDAESDAEYVETTVVQLGASPARRGCANVATPRTWSATRT